MNPDNPDEKHEIYGLKHVFTYPNGHCAHSMITIDHLYISATHVCIPRALLSWQKSEPNVRVLNIYSKVDLTLFEAFTHDWWALVYSIFYFSKAIQYRMVRCLMHHPPCKFCYFCGVVHITFLMKSLFQGVYRVAKHHFLVTSIFTGWYKIRWLMSGLLLWTFHPFLCKCMYFQIFNF